MAEFDKRKHPRMKMNFNVVVWHPEMGRTLMKTRDMSDGGVYVQGVLLRCPKQGAVVNVQVKGMLGSGCASVPMSVVRGDQEGLALQFLH